jgi:hypothetical protein
MIRVLLAVGGAVVSGVLGYAFGRANPSRADEVSAKLWGDLTDGTGRLLRASDLVSPTFSAARRSLDS